MLRIIHTCSKGLSHPSRKCFALYQRQSYATLPEGVAKLLMPALSPTMEAGTIVSWKKKEGELASAGDILCEIETDKATVDYEMQDDAVLAKILIPAGTTDVPVGTLLAYTTEDEDIFAELVKSGDIAKLSTESSAKEETSVTAVVDEPVAAKTESVKSAHHRTPRIKFLGKRSLLTENQVVSLKSNEEPIVASSATTSSHSAQGSSDSADSNDYTDIPLTNMRKVIAKRLTQSKVTVPHYYISIDCEIDAIMALRKRLKASHKVNVSLNDFILKSVGFALRDVPESNCYFDPQFQIVKQNKSIDISVAVATDTGLITPIVTQVDGKGLHSINQTFKSLVDKARSNKLKPEEYQGGSFTVSNLGGFGIDNFSAVINPPQACIMAVGKGRKEVVMPKVDLNTTTEAALNDLEPRIATLMNVTLSADRRVVDDVIGGQFLQTFKTYMENPELMIL